MKPVLICASAAGSGLRLSIGDTADYLSHSETLHLIQVMAAAIGVTAVIDPPPPRPAVAAARAVLPMVIDELRSTITELNAMTAALAGAHGG